MEDTLELINSITPELREQFKKDYIKIEVWRRKILGWEVVYEELKGKFYKGSQLSISKIR